MARPSFVVHHLIFCTSVEYPDVRRPLRDSTLNGVDYTFRVPPGTEFPIEPAEFWLYARFYCTSATVGPTRPLSVTCVWLDAPTGQEVEVWTRPLGRVTFRRPDDVFDRAWAFRNTEDDHRFGFPGRGRYEFRLWHPVRRWTGRRVKAREHIRVEVRP